MKWVRTLGFAAAAVACVIVVAAVIFYTWAGISGRRAWAETRAELADRGELLSLVDSQPAELPDEFNFFGLAVWRDLFESVPTDGRADDSPFAAVESGFGKARLGSPFSGKRGTVDALRERFGDRPDLANALVAHAPVLREIRWAAGRSGARAPVDYARGFATPMPHLNEMLRVAQAFAILAVLRMEAGDSDGAATELGVVFRCADALEREPFVLSLLVRAGILGVAINGFWECSVAGAFSAAELAAIQSRFESADLVGSLGHAFRTERGGFNDFADGISGKREIFLRARAAGASGDDPCRAGASGFSPFVWSWIYPYGYFFEDRATYNRALQGVVDDLDGRRRPDLEAHFPKPGLLGRRFFSGLAMAPLAGVVDRIYEIQAQLALAAAACAVERSVVEAGELPESLDALVPRYLAAVPLNPSLAIPVEYERGDQSAYRLSTDSASASPPRGTTDGRWVWHSRPGAD